jgi:hypothetical protein
MTQVSSDTDSVHNLKENDLYDPDHPDADWSGFVTKRSCRKYIQSQPNQIAPANDGSNFGPTNNAQTVDWSKPARRIVPYKESGAATTASATGGRKLGNDEDDHIASRRTFQIQQQEQQEQDHNKKDKYQDYNKEHNGDENYASRSATFTLIGGPIPVNDPFNFSPKCWETEAQAAARKMKTDLHQLTNNGRSIHVRGKKRRTVTTNEDYALEDLSEEENSLEEERRRKSTDTISIVDMKRIHGDNSSDVDPQDLIGFRGGQFISCTKNPIFLKEIGEAVGSSAFLSSKKEGELPYCDSIGGSISNAPYASDCNLPTDPYKCASGERRKDMLLENFSSVVPGYTGKRTFIN